MLVRLLSTYFILFWFVLVSPFSELHSLHETVENHLAHLVLEHKPYPSKDRELLKVESGLSFLISPKALSTKMNSDDMLETLPTH